MGNVICPKCGDNKCELNVKGYHYGCLWIIIFGWLWVIYALIKWSIGLAIALLFDWWIAIIKALQKKPYYWHCKKWFMKRNIYYCPNCGNNFKA